MDFDLPELHAAHARLTCGPRFFYGDVAKLNISIPTQGSILILLDTLRYIEEPQRLGRLGAQNLTIKRDSGESCDAALAEG